ncbi:MAG TPA: M12 family metallo-peptidase [Thermoanaerobaculia bacterium]|jgi:hypothetical protein
MFNRPSRLALAASLLFFFTTPGRAAMQHRMSAGSLAPLAAPLKAGAKLRIAHVPLLDGEEAELELERFQVWADHAEIKVFGENQQVVERLAPPSVQYFRGHVAGHPDSLVFLALHGRRTEGLVYVDGRKFTIGTERGAVVVQESSSVDDSPAEGERFTCDVEGTEIHRPRRPHAIADASGVPVSDAAPTGTQRSVINLAVETDSELYAKVANNAANLTTYIGNLMAAVSTVYQRDLNTEIRIVFLGIQNSAATDVFTITPGQTGLSNGAQVTYTARHGMLQLGDRWALTPPTTNSYSAATLVSGTGTAAGIAWRGTLCGGTTLCGGNCGSDAANGHYAGPFSFNGGITPPGSLSVPNPDAHPDYVAPGSNYWPLLQVSHELGHNLGSRHTHCISLTAAQKSEYGVTRNFVDTCYSGESGCYAGSTAVPAEKGSIMSYCHLSGGGASTRFTFGQDGETSEVALNGLLGNMASVTPGMSSIAAPASLEANVTGTASVTNAGHAYRWVIVNGTFAGGGATANGASVSFSGTANPVLLTVTATSSSGCAVTDRKSVTLVVPLTAPQGFTATSTGATAVALAWSAVAGASGYEIFRSSLGTNFVSIGTSPSPSYNDTTTAAGKAYLYRVRATAGATTGPFSSFDVATTAVFTDAALTAGATPVRRAHFTELLSAVNAVRTLAGLAAASFTAPTPATSVTVRRAHLLDLRTALDAARGALGLPPLSYTDPSIGVGTTRIKAAHVAELRNGVR